ncbi:hypothetical protein ACQEU3_20795 [Spirillospora sp. CA-253888]
MTEILFTAQALVDAAKRVDDLESAAADMRASADTAGPGDGLGWWGLIGNAVQLHSWYEGAAKEVHENVKLTEPFLRKYGTSLLQSAENYRKADKEILRKIKEVEKLLASGPTGTAKHERPSSLREAGPLRFDGLEDIPTVSSFAKGVKSASEGEFADLVSFGGDGWATYAGIAATSSNPADFLIRAGLTFLIDVIQPLEDALAYVTGHPERIDTAANKWGGVAKQAEELAKSCCAIPDNALTETVWSGPSAKRSRNRMYEFANGVDALGKEMTHLKAILGMSKTVMEVAQSFIIELIALFIQWLIAVWPAAMAAAVPTGGGSMAAAGAATATWAARAVALATRMIQKLRVMLFRIGQLLSRVAAKAAQEGPKALMSWLTGNVAVLPKLAGPAQDAWRGGGGTQGDIRQKLNPNDMPPPSTPPQPA